jgi:hypothetical protein
MPFIKYISDKYGDSDDFAPPVTIPSGASFKDMVTLKGKSDIGDKINTQIIQPLIDANSRLARSDFPDFNDPNKLGEGQAMVERLTNLIGIFEKPELDFSKNRAEHDDILGDAYEYLMRHFASQSGKRRGNPTPRLRSVASSPRSSASPRRTPWLPPRPTTPLAAPARYCWKSPFKRASTSPSKDLLEYVIVHEMVHLLEPTHSDRFMALLREHYPTWSEARAELNELPLTAEVWKEWFVMVRLDQPTSPSRHNVIGQKGILEIPPQKVNFAIQIISAIFQASAISAEFGKIVAIPGRTSANQYQCAKA